MIYPIPLDSERRVAIEMFCIVFNEAQRLATADGMRLGENLAKLDRELERPSNTSKRQKRTNGP